MELRRTVWEEAKINALPSDQGTVTRPFLNLETTFGQNRRTEAGKRLLSHGLPSCPAQPHRAVTDPGTSKHGKASVSASAHCSV